MDRSLLSIPEIAIPLSVDRPFSGEASLLAILAWAAKAVSALAAETNNTPTAALGKLRGNRRDLHFSALIDRLEHDRPLRMESPFEGSMKVSGGCWLPQENGASTPTASLAKLRWESFARDLPMHVHEHSDRCIVVLEGRGYFHVTDEPIATFSGRSVRTVPARERDVFLFTRGIVHTFSTLEYPMTLLSCQLPFLPFDHPKQYRLPLYRWTAATHPDTYAGSIGTGSAWEQLARTPDATAPIGLQHLLM